jgi:hypothetical protein
MMKALGWTYDENEKPNVDDWRKFTNDYWVFALRDLSS